MQIQVISDTHFEMFRKMDDFNQFIALLTGGVKKSKSILCIAGDLGAFHRQETWMEPLRTLARRYRAIVCIAGNHEYYNNCVLDDENNLFAMFKLPTNVHYLLNGSVIIDNVRFIGGTLWTSFYNRRSDAMEYALTGMNDYKLIRRKDGSSLTPAQTVYYHEKCKLYVLDQVRSAKTNKEKTVVISHHCISPQSVHPRYRGNLLNAAFFTDLSREIIQDGPDIWLHGHTHNSFDYMLGSTRVVCNPFGYLRYEENTEFNFRHTIRL